jgi:hypothetical protein
MFRLDPEEPQAIATRSAHSLRNCPPNRLSNAKQTCHSHEVQLKAPPGNTGAETCEHHDPKSDVVVPVVRVVPVAIGAAHVPLIVEEVAAPQHAVL